MSLPVRVHKIGTNKGRPRIWLDGPRLAEAGFVGGTVYLCNVVKGGIFIAVSSDPSAMGR